MDLGVREWFLILGGLMIVGVLMHGAWIFMRSRKNEVGYSYERNIPDVDVDDIELLRGELPSGGARVLRAHEDADANAAMVAAAAAAEDAEVARSLRERAKRPVNLDEQVPVLMDPIDRDLAADPPPVNAPPVDTAGAPPAQTPQTPQASQAPARPAAPSAPPPEADENENVTPEEGGAGSPEAEASPPAEPAQRRAPEGAAGAPAPARPGVAERPPAARDGQDDAGHGAHGDASPAGMEQAPLFAGEPIVARDPAARSSARSRGRDPRGADDRSAARKGRPAAPPRPEPRPLAPPEDVIVIRVLCKGGTRMPGPALLEVITDQALRFGDMNIFHRYARNDRGRIEFSLASAVEPGTFDLGAIDDFETPGVTLFMQLPGPEHPLEAFEDMVGVARALATELQADLKDEQHSVMTAQTIEHCRQRIREFTRRQMSRRA
ncbi:MAG TPA: cell division protein ZipA [Pseudomonadales bacterium]|nr:cell division protein ZipA [Pseudomonadales bacterium]